METIINQIINNLDFNCIININILTYVIIKIIDVFNGTRKVPKNIKIICLITSMFIITSLYLYNGYEDKIVLANSAIAAPVAWSWLLKPMFNKLNINYKK